MKNDTASVLGKILATQSLLHAAPDVTWLGEALAHALLNIPGVGSAAFYLGATLVAQSDKGKTPRPWPSTYAASTTASAQNPQPQLVVLPFETSNNIYGRMVLALDDGSLFQPYLPHIENTLSIAALVIENKEQKKELEEFAKTLEQRVTDQVQEIKTKETQFRQLFDEATYGIALGDPDSGLIVDCNGAFATMLGRTKKDLIGLHQRKLHPPEETVGDFTDSFVEHLGEKSGQTLVSKMVKSTGDIIDVEVKATLIDLGGRQYLQGFFNDITARILAEQRLLKAIESAEKARLSAEAANIEKILAIKAAKAGTLSLDFGTGYLQWDKRSMEIFGVDAETFHNNYESWARRVHEDDLESIQAQIDRAFASENSVDLKYRIIRPDGELRFVWAVANIVRDDQGDPFSLSGLQFDITGEKQAEKEREDLIAQLQDKTEEQERFIYTVSHDLKSPLVTISGFLGFLEQDFQAGDEARFRSDVGTIDNAVKRMKQLLEELLELSRVGIQRSPPEKVNLGHLVSKALENVSGRIQDVGAKIELDSDWPEVIADPRSMLQVLENLIDNAAKFSHSAPGGAVIRIGVRYDEGSLVCYVKDNGIGIDNRYEQRVFSLFEKLDPLSAGTGVGLAIVKRIVENHGGKVWVESAGPGRGTTFSFTLSEAKL